jgi:hypothetical protein
MNGNEQEDRRGKERAVGRHHPLIAACARGLRVRSAWWVVAGLLLAIASGYVYFEYRTPDATEGGFPSYMQNVDR